MCQHVELQMDEVWEIVSSIHKGKVPTCLHQFDPFFVSLQAVTRSTLSANSLTQTITRNLTSKYSNISKALMYLKSLLSLKVSLSWIWTNDIDSQLIVIVSNVLCQLLRRKDQLMLHWTISKCSSSRYPWPPSPCRISCKKPYRWLFLIMCPKYSSLRVFIKRSSSLSVPIISKILKFVTWSFYGILKILRYNYISKDSNLVLKGSKSKTRPLRVTQPWTVWC